MDFDNTNSFSFVFVKKFHLDPEKIDVQWALKRTGSRYMRFARVWSFENSNIKSFPATVRFKHASRERDWSRVNYSLRSRCKDQLLTRLMKETKRLK